MKDNDTRDEVTIRLEHGQPIRFGADGSRGVVRAPDGSLTVVDVESVGVEALVVHDAHDDNPTYAFALSRLSHAETLADTPIGIFRDVHRPTYDQLMGDQLDRAVEQRGPGDLATLLAGNDTWTIE